MQNSNTFKDLLLLLRTTVKPKEKAMLLSCSLDSEPYLPVILRLAGHYNVAPSKLQAFRKTVQVAKGSSDDPLQDCAILLQSFQTGEPKKSIVHNNSLELFEYMLSPYAIGVTPLQISSILANSMMTIEEAHSALGTIVPQETRKHCGICDRPMKALQSSGACRSCDLTAQTFALWRRGPFTVPISPFNFQYSKGEVNQHPVQLVFRDYLVTKQGSELAYEHIQPESPLDNLELPFEDYQLPICKLQNSSVN